MATILNTINRETAELYNVDDVQSFINVGLGTADPNIYHSRQYQRTQINHLLPGIITRITYAGAFVDRMPLIIPIWHYPQYNAVLAYNLRYCPPQVRKAIMKYIYESNRSRIKNNQPMIVDYHRIKDAVRESEGIVRMYKQIGVGVIESFPISETPNVIQENSPHQNVYRDRSRQ